VSVKGSVFGAAFSFGDGRGFQMASAYLARKSSFVYAAENFVKGREFFVYQ